MSTSSDALRISGPAGPTPFASKSFDARVGIDPPITPYELRHTAISMQADAGRLSREIADWAGTSEAMVSRVYRQRLRRVSPLRPV